MTEKVILEARHENFIEWKDYILGLMREKDCIKVTKERPPREPKEKTPRCPDRRNFDNAEDFDAAKWTYQTISKNWDTYKQEKEDFDKKTEIAKKIIEQNSVIKIHNDFPDKTIKQILRHLTASAASTKNLLRISERIGQLTVDISAEYVENVELEDIRTQKLRELDNLLALHDISARQLIVMIYATQINKSRHHHSVERIMDCQLSEFNSAQARNDITANVKNNMTKYKTSEDHTGLIMAAQNTKNGQRKHISPNYKGKRPNNCQYPCRDKTCKAHNGRRYGTKHKRTERSVPPPNY